MISAPVAGPIALPFAPNGVPVPAARVVLFGDPRRLAAIAAEILLTQPADDGSRIRLVTIGDGQTRHSNIVFVIDPLRVQNPRRRGRVRDS